MLIKINDLKFEFVFKGVLESWFTCIGGRLVTMLRVLVSWFLMVGGRDVREGEVYVGAASVNSALK